LKRRGAGNRTGKKGGSSLFDAKPSEGLPYLFEWSVSLKRKGKLGILRGTCREREL